VDSSLLGAAVTPTAPLPQSAPVRDADGSTRSITVEQHFFASAALGLSVAGWQTVAQSAGIGDWRERPRHCEYYRPEGRKELKPLSRGWYRLEDGRICLHRIIYSGLSYGGSGRQGNFLAHGLIFDKHAAETIDYDVTALFQWVEVHHPFFARHDKIYESLGWSIDRLDEVTARDREKLANYPTLDVPVNELRHVRSSLDDAFPKEVWQPLQKVKLGADSLGDLLLRAYFCPKEQRRPILLYGIEGNRVSGDDAWRTVNYLFTLLPFHCRRELTFSTYAADQKGSTAMPNHWDRRLVMTTEWNEVKLPTSPQSSFPFWVINCKTDEHVLPEESELAKWYRAALGRGDWQSLRGLRDLASDFDLGDETAGLQDCRQLLAGAGDHISRPRYSELASRVRSAKPELLNRLSAHMKDWKAGNKGADLADLTDGYLQLLKMQVRGPSAEVSEHQKHEICSDIGRLFYLAVVDREQHVQTRLLDLATDESLPSHLRESIVDSYWEALKSQTGNGNADIDVDFISHTWHELNERKASARSADTRRAVSEGLARWLVRTPEKVVPQLRSRMKDFVLPVLCQAQLVKAAELNAQLTLLQHLRQIEPDTSHPGCDLLVHLWENKKLLKDHVFDLLKHERGYVLSHSDVWLEAAEKGAWGCLTVADLIHAFWSMSPGELTRDDLKGVLKVVDRRASQDDEGIRQILEGLTANGLHSFGAAFGPFKKVSLPTCELQTLVEVHLALVNRLIAAASPKDKPFVERSYLQNLIVLILACPVSDDPRSEKTAHLLKQPVLDVSRLFSDVANRSRFFSRVGQALSRWPSKRPELRQARVKKSLTKAFSDTGIKGLQAEWLVNACQAAALDGYAFNGAQVAAEWLCSRPKLMSGRQGTMGQYLSEIPGVWEQVGEKFLKECGTTDMVARKRALHFWLTEDRGRQEALSSLKKMGRLDPVALRLVLFLASPSQASLEELNEILDLSCQGGFEAIARNLRPVVRNRYTQLALLEGLANWKQSDFREQARPLLDELQKKIKRPGIGEICKTLFSWLASHRDAAEFRDCYVAMGDGLMKKTDPIAQAGTGALAGLCHDSLFADLLQAPAGKADDLLDVLKKVPQGQDGEPFPEWILPARARFAAVLYDRDYPGDELAGAYAALATESHGKVSAYRIADVLTAYLTMKGSNFAVVRSRAGRLCRRSFWGPFTASVGEDKVATTCEWLSERLKTRVPDADRIIRLFRRKIGWTGFLWNYSPFWR
jgi:hypothetical protein